jgi:hypothetical protein
MIMTKPKPIEEHEPRGRPTEYREEYNDLARKFCLLTNATDKTLAAFFEVHVSTIHAWKIAHPDFADSIKAGKEGADINVAEAAVRSAVGYTVDLIEREMSADGKTVTGFRIRQQHIPASATAQKFWLINRHGEHWRDRLQVQPVGPGGGAPVLLTGQITPEQAAQAYMDMLNGAAAQAVTEGEEEGA